MNRQQILNNMKKLELQRKIDELNKRKDLENGIPDVIKEFDIKLKNKDKNKKYLMKHVKEAEEILTKIAFGSSNNRFCEYENINIEWSDSVGYENGGNWDLKNNKITINRKYLLDDDKYKRSFNKKIIDVIQHELIHVYISKNEKFNLNSSTDASPIHQAIIVFFNSNGCSIGSNGNLADIFKEKQKQLYKLSSNKNVCFLDLINYLYKSIKNVGEILERINQEVLIKKENKVVFAFFYKSTDKSYVNKYFKNSKEMIEININLGMDCDLDNFEKFIYDLIKTYECNK